jgi:hypothetical protein
MRDWEVDEEATEGLIESSSLSVLPVFNAAVLQVKAPSTKLSYMIEWRVPDGPERRDKEEAEEARRSFHPKDDYTAVLAKIVEESRRSLFVDEKNADPGGGSVPVALRWEHPLNATLMIFNLEGKLAQHLSTLAQLHDPPSGFHVDKPGDIEPFKYGDGVAGRAFKVNKMRVYSEERAKMALEQQLQPEFYIKRENSTIHRGLVSFPIHPAVTLPVLEAEGFNSYATREPFGVLSLGTDSGHWPMGVLTDPARNRAFQMFQHYVNKVIDARRLEILRSRPRH